MTDKTERRKPPTIFDVAERAGVGIGTVSRVLNESARVADTTRQRVLEAIAALDYRPSALARGLSLGRTSTIGIVVPFFTHPSAVARLRGIVDVLRTSEYDIVLHDVETPTQRDRRFAEAVRRGRAEGLIVISLRPTDTLASGGHRVVYIDVRDVDAPHLYIDDVEGGRMVARHLLELGHERVAFIGDEPDPAFGFSSSADRLAGFREVLEEAGLAPQDPYLRFGPHDRVVAVRLAAELLSLPERPTAIFAASDFQAYGVLEAARSLGVDVPGQLSVVGFDDTEPSNFLGLTTVRQPLRESGRLGAERLLDLLAEQEVPTAEELPLELVVRETTAPPS